MSDKIRNRRGFDLSPKGEAILSGTKAPATGKIKTSLFIPSEQWYTVRILFLGHVIIIFILLSGNFSI